MYHSVGTNESLVYPNLAHLWGNASDSGYKIHVNTVEFLCVKKVRLHKNCADVFVDIVALLAALLDILWVLTKNKGM